MSCIKEVNIKNCTYYFFNDVINSKSFDLNWIKINKKSYRNIAFYYIGYFTIKNISYAKINSVNPLYFITDKADEYIEESNGNKYLTLVFTDKNKATLKTYTELWDKITNTSCDYDEKYMKIKLNSDDNLPLNKTLKLHN